MFCSIWFHQAWCKPVESNHLPLGYRPRPSPFGLACEAEDCRLNWYPFRDSNPGSRFVGPTLWAAKLKGCGAPGAIRTRTSCGLNAVTPASWSTGAWRPPRGIEPGTCCLQGSCSAAELDGRKMNKRLGRPTGAAGSLFLIVHNVKQRDPTGPSTCAATRARIRETLRSRRGDWCRTHASAGRVTRAKPVFAWNSAGLCPPACRRRASPAAG